MSKAKIPYLCHSRFRGNDIRHFFRAMQQSLWSLAISSKVDKNDYVLDASIKRFEFVIELFWKVLKKILTYEKIDSTTPRDVLSKAFQFSIIDNEEIWLKMLDERNNTSHVDKYEDAKRVFENIKLYLPILEKTYNKLEKKYFG